jgi:hypothetical protein
MVRQEVAKVQFMDGVAVEDVVRIFLAADLQSGNYNYTRLFYWREDGEWGFFDVETIVVSVTAVTRPRRAYFALGQDGVVWSAVGGSSHGPVIERIPDAGTGKDKYGYVSQIREIGNELYVCGDQGQVYKRTTAGWQHIDQGILHKERRKYGISHNSIDGTSPSDIYAVGDYGKIFHFDGRQWSDVSFSTNLHFQRVKCISSDEVYVCGEKGILVRGNVNGWEVVADLNKEATIWDLEMFNKKLYLAVEDRLMVYNGREIVAVDTKLVPQIDAHRLSARNDFLWSFGENDLAYYDGKKWVRVVHPDNA